MDESGSNEAECHRKGTRKRSVASAIRSLATLVVFNLRVLQESLMRPVLMYGSATMKRGSGVRALQMGNNKGLLDIRRMDVVTKGLNEG